MTRKTKLVDNYLLKCLMDYWRFDKKGLFAFIFVFISATIKFRKIKRQRPKEKEILIC